MNRPTASWAPPGGRLGSSGGQPGRLSPPIPEPEHRTPLVIDAAEVSVDVGDTALRLSPADRQCWLLFRLLALAVASAVVFTVYAEWAVPTLASVRLYSVEYFFLCLLGGAISGVPHTLVTPLDLLKCRSQVGEFASVAEGLVVLRQEYDEAAGAAAKFGVVYRGWAPTLIGYGLQGALKFGLYEYFKFLLGGARGGTVVLFLMASAGAEFFADIGLAPWEAVKVRIQTNMRAPPILENTCAKLWAAEGLSGFYKGLPALWCRQIPYTMVKFATFEKTAATIAAIFAAATGLPPISGLPLLLVTVAAGFTAGTLCAVVSHPADTVVSRMNQPRPAGDRLAAPTAAATVAALPCRELWRGLTVRVAMVGTLTALQWLFYDGFKSAVGLPTTAAARSIK